MARGLETEWNTALQQLADADAELARREAARPRALSAGERAAILALGDDLGAVWDAPTTSGKDRKQLLRTLLDEVSITLHRDDPGPHASLVLRWKGLAISELTVPLRRPQPKIRTDEDTIALIRRLAVHYPDATIAGILSRQHRTTARGLSFTASRVASLRTNWHIPCHQPGDQAPEGELLNVTQAARELQIAPSTLLRWLDDGFVAGEQVTPGAPWQIRVTDQLRGMLTGDAPDGWLALHHASRALGVSRQTVLQKVKRGELRAVLTRQAMTAISAGTQIANGRPFVTLRLRRGMAARLLALADGAACHCTAFTVSTERARAYGLGLLNPCQRVGYRAELLSRNHCHAVAVSHYQVARQDDRAAQRHRAADLCLNQPAPPGQRGYPAGPYRHTASGERFDVPHRAVDHASCHAEVVRPGDAH